ncbi:MAG: hypothetical protein ACREKH_09980 [Candidatus Rokuibacteriota bacterium]
MLGLSPLSPSLVHGFALSRFEVAFIVPSIYVGGLLFSLPAGRLADRIGVRPTLRPFGTPLTAGLLAFATGVGAYGWVGIFFVMSAEIGGPKDAGLLSGMAFTSIVVGLLTGPALFGLLLVSWDSYAVPWSVFAVLAALVAAAMLFGGPAIDRVRQ